MNEQIIINSRNSNTSKSKSNDNTTTNEEDDNDRAFKAYSAIKMQLDEWNAPYSTESKSPLFNENTTTTNIHHDNNDEDDEFVSSFISRRKSGAFSPAAATTPSSILKRSSSSGSGRLSIHDVDRRRSSHLSTADDSLGDYMDTVPFADPHEGTTLNDDDDDYDDDDDDDMELPSASLPVTTPAKYPSPQPPATPLPPPPSPPTTTLRPPPTLPPPPSTLAHQRTIPSLPLPPHTHLDSDYLPYHQALLTLLAATSPPSPIPTPSTATLHEAHASYARTLVDSVYSRSTTLSSLSVYEDVDGGGGVSEGGVVVKRLLEGEGHVWALLERLLGVCVVTRTSRVVGGGGVKMVKRMVNTGGGSRFVLWEGGCGGGGKAGMGKSRPHNTNDSSSVSAEIERWVHNLVNQNGNRTLDSAEMWDFVSTYYDLEQEEEEEDDDDAILMTGGTTMSTPGIGTSMSGEGLDTIMEGDDEEQTTSGATTPTSTTTATTIEMGNSARFGRGLGSGRDHRASSSSPSERMELEDGVGVCPMPDVVRRRQIVLRWLESCHGRAVVGYRGGGGGMGRKVMWKDTIQALLHRQQRGGGGGGGVMSRDGDKINSFHPDAPLLFLQNKTTSTTASNNTNTKPSISSLINPLYGSDNSTERYLLSTCLSLIKAGRFPEALEMTRDYGQSWRAACWGGNAPCGRRRQYHDPSSSSQTVNGDGEEDEDEDFLTTTNTPGGGGGGGEEKKEEMITERFGNPKRALWKRTMWNNARSLRARLHSTTPTGGEKGQYTDGTIDRSTTILSSESLVYEAAITAILADDVESASSNPALNHNWLDLVWVRYRGMQTRFMEQVYHAHNEVRRRSSSGGSMFLLEGTECPREEREQIGATEELGRVEEGEFLEGLRRRFVVGEGGQDEDGEAMWRDCMGSFLMGKKEVEQFVIRAVSGIVDRNELGLFGGHRDETLLRFVLHLLLFLDTLSQIDHVHDIDVDNDDGLVEQSLFYFRREIIQPRKNALLLLYVKHLSTQKPLWHLIALYASLLEDEANTAGSSAQTSSPNNLCVDFCTKFWTECVVEEADRRMVLHRAREYFTEGLDLLILRRVVRSSITPEDPNVDGQAESSKPFPSSWLHFSDDDAGDNADDELNMFARNANLEESILSTDVRKMHSIHWLCYHQEHAADALICANLLLRKLLFEAVQTREYLDAEDDWSENVKLYTAKVFTFRIFPSDIFDEVSGQYQDNTQTRSEEDDDAMEDDQQLNYTLSSNDFVRENIVEHRAMVTFLHAHDAYLEWNDVITRLSPTVSAPEVDAGTTTDRRSALQSEISNKMRKKKYVDQKRDVAHAVIKAAEVARVCLMGVLTFDGGWLELTTARYAPTAEDEYSQRLEEMKFLRSKYLPNAVFLLFHVLDETAQWMDEFARDTSTTFGKDEGSCILSRISGTKSDDPDFSPFSPAMWHRTALLLANTVANNAYDISSCLNQDELKLFMNYMAASTVSLLRCNERA